MPFLGKEIIMDSLSGMDVRLNETKGFGEVQQEGYADIGESFGRDFFSDMQAIGYNPFEEEDESQETYPDDVGLEETEGYLPAGPAQIPDAFSGEETRSVEETGGQHAGGKDAGELEDPERGVGSEESEDSEVPEDPGDDPEEHEDSGEALEESEKKAHTDGKSEETRRADEAAAEERRRAEHEASEAKRRAEWEARQKEAVKAQLERIRAMNDEELAAQSMKRVEADTEKLTRRNMKECVSEYVQTACLEDAGFARQAMLPQKNMVRCFQYINRKAYEYVQDEMKANGIQPGRDTSCYASDIPDELCYHWAEEYFRTMDVKEDREEEEEFVPKPYMGKGSPDPSSRKSAGRKAAASQKTGKAKAGTESRNGKGGKGAKDGGGKSDGRPAEKRQKAADDGQLSFIGQMAFSDFEEQEVKAG